VTPEGSVGSTPYLQTEGPGFRYFVEWWFVRRRLLKIFTGPCLSQLFLQARISESIFDQHSHTLDLLLLKSDAIGLKVQHSVEIAYKPRYCVFLSTTSKREKNVVNE